MMTMFASTSRRKKAGHWRPTAIAILTEWDTFAEQDFEKIHESMPKPAFLFDGRNITDLKETTRDRLRSPWCRPRQPSISVGNL